MKSEKKLVSTNSLSGHHGSVNYIIQLSNGNIASCSDDSSMKIWDIKTNKVIACLEDHFSRVTCLLELPNNILASGSFDTSIRLWDLTSNKCIAQLTAHVAWVLCMLLLKDGRLVSGSGDKTMRIWNLKNKTCSLTLKGHDGFINAMIEDKNNNVISSSEDNTIKYWDIKTGDCLKSISYDYSISTLCQLRDGRVIIASDKIIKLLDSEEVIESEECISSRIFETSNDGEIIYGDENGELTLLNINNKTKIKAQKHDDTITSAICLNDGRYATCANDALIMIWELQ